MTVRPLDGVERNWLAVALSLAVLAVSYGFYLGDLTPREANYLVTNASGQMTRWGQLWLMLPIDPLLVPTILRGVSVVAIFWLAWLAGTTKPFGTAGRYASGLLFLLSPISIWLANQATDEALIVLLMVLGIGALRQQEHRTFHRVLGVLLFLVSYILLVDPVIRNGSFVGRERWLPPPTFAMVLGSPALMAVLLGRPWRWNQEAFEHRQLGCRAALAALMLIPITVVIPGRWTVVALGMAWISSRAAAAVLETWREAQLPPVIGRRLKNLSRILAFGLPTLLIVVGLVRIAMVYQFMERIEAGIIVAGCLLALAPRLLQRNLVSAAVIISACVCVGKGVWSHALQWERDLFHSTRMFANAVRLQTDPGTEIRTDLPIDSTFKWYVRRTVQPVKARSKNHSFVLLVAERSPTTGAVLAHFRGSPFGPVRMLQASETSTRIASEDQPDKR
jgi:hypothetical protein